MNTKILLEHLYIVFFSVVLSILAGLPLGVAAYLWKPARKPILRLSELLQTIPALALLGMVMLVLGAGKTTVITGLLLYSLLPIVHNTYIGLEAIDPGVKRAARGMGMSRWDRLMTVELPLSFPMIFAGIRIAAVTSVGIAVFAASVGGGGLGSVINRGIRTQNIQLILSGTLTLMAMALVLDGLMAWLEHSLKSGRR
ncbi:MAG TPA: ABC transporter permease [Clostridiaceae bacterium]|nr:ABC transporter permease [Clostridiaceae bacterium]